MAKAAYPTIGIAALVMFGIVYFIGCLHKNELWQKILHIAITILTAIATTFGVTSCIGLMN